LTLIVYLIIKIKYNVFGDKMDKNIKIVFMGTPEIARAILHTLINEGYNVVGVVSQEDKPVGRKNILKPTPVKEEALEHNIPVFQPHKIRNDYNFLVELKPDLIITCAYGQLVPQAVLDIPQYGCLNVHGSLLPKYRGASPIQSALINGDKVTGVTIMEMILAMDAGRIFYKKEVNIDEEDDYSSLLLKITNAGSLALKEMLPLYLENKIQGIPQDDKEVTTCSKITKNDEHLSLDNKINFVNWVRGLSKTPGGYLLLDGVVFKIYKAKVVDDKIIGQIGEITKCDKSGLHLQLKDGTVALLEVQKQGKNIMDYKAFVNGAKILGKVLN
jgi:methionyl-tRNA formyltransferase